MASKPPESSESSSDSSTASSSPPRRGVFIDEGRNEIRFIDDPEAIVREPPSPSTPAPAKSALKRSSSAPAASSHHRTALLLSSWSQDMEFSSKAGDERPKPPRGTRMLRLKAEKEAASKPQPPPKKLPSSSEEDSDVSDTDKDAKQKKATKEAAAQRESRSRDSEDDDGPGTGNRAPGPSRGRRRQPTPFVRGASHDGSSDGADSAGASTSAASKTKASSQSSKSKTDFSDVSDEDDDDPGLKEKPKPFEDIDEAIAAIEKALREDAEEEVARKAASKASARPPRPPPKQASTVDVSATSPPPAAAAAAAAAPPQTAQSDTVLLSEDDPTSDFVEVLAEKRPPSPTASEIEILDDAAPVRGAGSGSGYSAEDLAEMMRGSIVDSDEDGIGAGGGDGGSPGGMSIGESDEDDGQDGEVDDDFMHLIDDEGDDIRENVDEPMEEQQESMGDTAIRRAAADAEAAEEAIEDLVESMDDVAIKGSPKKGAAGETMKRKKHLTEADKLLSDEGALKMLTTASPRRRRAAASDDKKRRTSPRKPASATEESDDSQIEKMDGGDDRDKKKKTKKKHISEAERLRMERLRVQNIPESLTPRRQSTTAQGGTSGTTAHDESTMASEVSDVAVGEKSVGEEEAENTKGTDPFVAPTSPAARRASLVPDSSTESAESSAESEARKKKVEARQALPMKVASEEDSASDTPGKKEKRKRLTEAERLLHDEMVQKVKESQEQKRSPTKTGVTAGKSKDFDDEDDDEEKAKKKRLTVAGGRLSGSPEKEQSPAKKSAAPVDSEDSEREDDDTNQVEGKKKKKKYAKRTEKVAADDAGVMEMTSLTLPSAPIDDSVEVSTDETKEGETRSKPKRKRRSEADKLLGDEGVRKMLAEEESKSRSRAEGAEPGNQAGEEPVEEPVDEMKKEEVNEEGDKKRSEEKTRRKRRSELDTLGLDEGVQRMGISPLGERPKRRGRSVEGARTYALDLDEEEEEEEEHQEDDWMPSDADHDDQEPMDEPAIPEDPTIVDEPMEPVDAQAGEQPGEKADDVFAKPATPSEASTTPSAKSAGGTVQSGAEGASSAISSAPSTEGSSAAGGVRKPKRRPKTEIENLLFSDETSIKHFEEQKRNYEERQRELQKSKISKAERARIVREAAARQQEEIAANVRRIDEAEAEEERQMKKREERRRAEAEAKRAEREAQARREEEARKITEKMELAELRELLLREGRQLRQVRGPGHDRHASVRSTRLEEEEEVAARGREREARGTSVASHTSHASVRSHASIRSHVSARSARLEEEMAARRAEEAAHPERAPARMTPAQLAAVAAHMRAVFGLRAAPSSSSSGLQQPPQQLQPPTKAAEPQSKSVGSKARSRLEMEEAARLAQHQSELMQQQQQQQQMREEEEERREHRRRVEAHDEQVARMMQERERLAAAEQEQLAAALDESLRTAEQEKALRRAQGQADSDDDNETGGEPKPGGSGLSRQRMTLDEQLRAASVALGPPESASTQAEIAEARRKKAAAAKEELLASRQGRPVQPPAEEVEQFEHESEAMRLATMEAKYNEIKKSEVQKRLEAREAAEAAAAGAAAAAQPSADSAGSSSVSATASIVDESPTTTKPKQRKQRVREADKLKQDEGVKKMNIDNDSPDAPKQQRTRTAVHREGQIQLPDELPEGEAEHMFDAVPTTQKTPKQQKQQLQPPQLQQPLRQLPPQPQIRPNELIESMRQMASKARASRTDSGLRPGMMISLFPLPRQLHVEMSGIPQQQQQHDVPSNEIVADEPTDEASLAEKPSLIYPHDYLEEQEFMIKSEPALSAFDQDGNLIGQLTSPLKPPAGFEMFEDMGEPPAGFEMFEDMGEESHIPKPPTGFPSPGGMTGHQGETPTTSSLLPPGPPPPSTNHAVFDAMAAFDDVDAIRRAAIAASHAARAAPTVPGHPTRMGLAAEAPLFRATDFAGGVIRHISSYQAPLITQPHPIGQGGGDEEDDELLDVGGPDDYGAQYDDAAVGEAMEQQMEVDEAEMAPKKKLSTKKGQKESKGFAAIKARHDKYQDEQRAMAELSGIVESDDEDKPSDNDHSPKKKKLPERKAKAAVMSARLRARKQPSPDDPGDDDDGSGSGSGSGDDVSDDSEESFEVKKSSKAEKDEKRRKMAIIAAQRMENEERAKREEEARLREETTARAMEQARIEALQAQGARPHDVVDDDGMTMDYDDGHMDWGDDGHHHSMIMQQQSSAARIPRAPTGPPARTPLGPPRRPPGTPAKRARGSLSLIPGPRRRPRDPKKLQQRKPRSPSKKKRAARPPKAPPVQEDPNLPPWRQKINAVLRRRDRLILVALPGVTQNRIFARCRSTNKNKKDFWGYSFLPLEKYGKILNRQRAWRFVDDSILIFRLPDGTFTYTDPSDPEDEFRRDGPRRYAAMLLQRRVTQKKTAAQRMPTLQQWLEEAAIERREKAEKEREQLYWDSDLDSEERRSEGGSLSPGEPLHHTTPRMASIDAETIRRHMAELTIGTEEMARRYREGKYPEPWRALLDDVDNDRNRALTEREEEAEENEEWRHDAPEDKIPIPYELSRRPILVKYMETLDNDPHFSKQYISEKELNTIRAQLIGMERLIMNYEESTHRKLPTKKHDYKLYACRSLELNAVFKRRHEKDQQSRAVQYPEEFELIRQADESLGIAVTPDARTEIYYTKGNRAEELEVKKLMEETGFPVKGRLPKRRFIKIKTDLFFPEYFISLSIFTKKAMPEKWLQLMDRSRRNWQNGPFEQKLEIKLLLDSRRMTGFVRTLHRRNFIDTTKVTLSQVMGWNQQLIDYHWTFDQINASVDDLLSETKSWKQHADEKVQHQWRRGLRPGTGLDPVTFTKAKKRRVKAPKPAKIRHPRSWGPTTATAEQQEPEKEQPKEMAETGPPKKRGRPPKKNKKKPGRKPKLLQPAESEQ